MQNTDINISKILLDFYNYKALSVELISGYDDLNYILECVDLSHNSEHRDKYVLKIVNVNDSKREGLTEAIMDVLRQIPQLQFEIPKPVTCTTGGYVGQIDTSNGVRKVILMSYVTGLEYKNLKFKSESFLSFCYKIGLCAGKLTAELFKIKDPRSALKRVNDYYLIQYMHIEDVRLNIVNDENVRNICSIVLQKLKDSSIKNEFSQIRKGVIHNDMCLENFIFKKLQNDVDNYLVKGIIDFSDMGISYYVYEAAIPIASAMYATVTSPDINPYDAAKTTLSGFEKNFSLTDDEKKFLFYAVLARFVYLRVICGYDACVSEQTSEHEMHESEPLEYFINLMWKDGKNK